MTTTFRSINPSNEKVLAEYPPHSTTEVNALISRARDHFSSWRSTPVDDRARLLQRLGQTLKAQRDALAELMTLEMGKPILQARSEVEKCALLCDYYAKEGPPNLRPLEVQGNSAKRSYIRFDPMGAVLAVMPWNYPLWQVFRFAVPTLLTGNVGILKHATNVLGCAAAIERVFLESGFPQGTFLSLNVDRDAIPGLIEHPFVRAVTLTGSEKAGIAVAEAAGRQLKKCVLELGGSDPFIVLPDADLQRTIRKAVESRTMNNGQSCIAAKRFLVHRDVYEEFVEGMTAGLQDLKVGDPMQEETQLGPLAREDLRETLHKQVLATFKQGGRLCTGGTSPDRPGWFYQPTLLSDVEPGMTAFDEETFGPVAAVTRVDSAEHAIELANRSEFGLGASLWTSDLTLAEQLAANIDSGNVFINEYTKSDPTLPFGGVKKSGFGRELGTFGLREFVNIKTVWVDSGST
ncbi:NAD-dependent succinate-semialdehyde dehydrogenase [Planctomicrobium sp. SH661]|uniref:NAD-dependent succinate-semialdehyde dehydrogenase n=1 Tax=Planctomicrobium sp. SH661 TaxID=3448124 RepID=UPI003F5BEC51